MRKHSFEYEIIADANIVGEFSHNSFYFKVFDIGQRSGEKRLLWLRVEDDEELSPSPPDKPREFIYLASLFLRRRLILGHMTRHDNNPIRMRPDFLIGTTSLPLMLKSSIDRFIDIDIVIGQTNLKELSKWYSLMERLETNKRQKFVLSASLYSRALEHIEFSPDIAYLNLISAIENLCQDTDIDQVELSDIDKGLALAIKKIETHELQLDITKRILKRERFIGRKFVKFIENHLDASFWNYPRRPEEHLRIKQDKLSRFLDNIYKQRSLTLHYGEPFPTYVYQLMDSPSLDLNYIKENVTNGYSKRELVLGQRLMEEIPVGTSISNGVCTWESKDYIPYPHFFERLVNHALKNYLESEITQ